MKKKLFITTCTITLLFSSICQFSHTYITPAQEASENYLVNETSDDRPKPPKPTKFNF